MNWIGLKYQIKAIRRDKLCILTFLLPILAGLAVNLLGDMNFAAVAKPAFGVIQDDISGEAFEWLRTHGSVEIYEDREELEAEVKNPSTQTIGVVSDGSEMKTIRSGDELTMYAAIADTLPRLYEQRNMTDRYVLDILPAGGKGDIMESLLIVIIMVTAMFMGCTFNAMNILSEKEEGIMFVNEILPMTRTQYVKQKIAVGFLGGILSTVITALICMRPSAAQVLPLFLLIVLSAFLAALTGLFVARFSSGIMVGIMYIKIVMILFLAPPILFYLLVPSDGAWHGLTYIFPSSATFYGLMDLLNGRAFNGKNLIILSVHIVVWFLLYVRQTAARRNVF